MAPNALELIMSRSFNLFAWISAAALLAGLQIASVAQSLESRLVVFRPNGGAVSVPCVIKIADENFGFVGNKRYFELPISPGLHSISAADSFRSDEKSLEALEISFEAGETKFILCKRASGLLPFGDFQLTLSNKSSFENLRPKLKAQDQSRLTSRRRD
jgi:hypothetical protein